MINAGYYRDSHFPLHGDSGYPVPVSQRLEDLEFQLVFLERRPSSSQHVSELDKVFRDVKDLRRELRMGQSSRTSSDDGYRNTIDKLSQEAKEAAMQVRASANLGPLIINGETVSPRCFVPRKTLSDGIGQLERVLCILQNLSLVSMTPATRNHRAKAVRFVLESIRLLNQAWKRGGGELTGCLNLRIGVVR